MDHHTDAIVSFDIFKLICLLLSKNNLSSDVELGNGSAPEARIYMPHCEGSICTNVEVQVASQEGSIYMMHRQAKIIVGDDYIEAPIIVSIFCIRYCTVTTRLTTHFSEKLHHNGHQQLLVQ